MIKQYATFYVSERLYGIDVIKVQEVTRKLALTPVRLAPSYVEGLINLRGQIAAAIGLRALIEPNSEAKDHPDVMTIVCRTDDGLLSFLVDRIGDVVEVTHESFEPVPDNLDERVKRLLVGVHKLEKELLSIIDIEKLNLVLNHKENENAA